MTTIAFVGLGKMGLPMARNLLKAGFDLAVFDVVPTSIGTACSAGAKAANSVGEAVALAEVVISMLPEGHHVTDVYLGAGGVLQGTRDGALLIDCSTIDIGTTRSVAAAAHRRGLEFLDAPVSGGVAGAEAGTLTFMVGGSDAAYARAEPLLAAMGKAAVHTGPSGTGQAAKICNNMILGASMIVVSEAFALAEGLGLSQESLFEVASKSSGQCWSLTSYCPVPGPVPSSPANRGYAPGFTAAMMAKDLRLAQAAAAESDVATPLGAQARNLYALLVGNGCGDLDFSVIFKMIAGQNDATPAK